jgi:outer membrane protein TolC
MNKILFTAMTTIVVSLFSVNFSVAETTLTNLLSSSLEAHEDVINASKKSEEAGRDVTDALYVYAPDIKITTTNFTDEKREANSNYDINGDTFDIVWDQTIYDSGKNWADISSARLKATKAQIELDQARNSHAIEAAEAYLDLIKASEKLATALEAEANTRVIQGQEEIRVEVGSGLASDELKAKQKLAASQKKVISSRKTYEKAVYTFEDVFKVDSVNVDDLRTPRLSAAVLANVPMTMGATVAAAMDANVDLVLAKIDLQIAENDVKVSRADFGPSISAQAYQKHKNDNAASGEHLYEEKVEFKLVQPLSGLITNLPGHRNKKSALDRSKNDLNLEEDSVRKAAKDAWQEYSNARTLLQYSENEAAISKELLTIATKEREMDAIDATGLLSAEETYRSAMDDVSADRMSLLTSVYDLLDVIGAFTPDMVEENKKEGTFNTSS